MASSTTTVVSGELTDHDVVRGALADEYDIVSELGRGGMAIVFLARDRALDREVAVKVLPLAMAFDADVVERFQREAKTAASLEHPNIVPIYRVGRASGDRVSYFVMKYVRGPSLGRMLAERPDGKLTPAEIREMLADTARALAYAARSGVVHRDIKPDNILFDDDRWVLADFGIAKVASARTLTNSGTSVGSPRYMSPEQARARPLDQRADIYSLGIVAYQCLVGCVPFDGEDGIAILYGHVTAPVPTPTLATDEERTLFAIVRRMMEKDPGDRVQDGDELLRVLDESVRPGVAVRATPAVLSSVNVPQLAQTATGFRISKPSRPEEPPTPVMDLSPKEPAPVIAAPPRRRSRARVVAVVIALLLAVITGLAYAGWRAIPTPTVTVPVAPVVAQLPPPPPPPPPVAPRPAPRVVTPRATFCDPGGGTSTFHVLMDSIIPPNLAYAVCGLPNGSHFRTVATISRSESGIQKLLGSSHETTKDYDDRSTGLADHVHHELPDLKSGNYTLELAVTDRRGRRRSQIAEFRVH